MSGPQTTATTGYGQQRPSDSDSDLNAISFVVSQMMARMSTMKLVKVVAVHGNGEVAAPGTVDVLPLVNQVDGNNNATAHGTVYGVPWWRLQGGPCAVVCDPRVDDIGYVVVSDRDISNVKANRKQSNPGSFRQYDLADGVYVGGVLNLAPTCYILFKEDGYFKLVDAHGNVLETTADGFVLTGKLTVTGNVAVTGAITATGEITRGLGGADPVTLGQHLHTSGGSGSPTSKPTAGT